MSTLASNPYATNSNITAKAQAVSISEYGVTLLRVALGIMFLAHGLQKFLVFTLPGTAGFFASVGFPGFFAYIVAPAELLAGIALLLGFQTRLIAGLTLPILLGALSVHIGNGWSFAAPNGGWEYPAYLVVLAAAQVLLGGGVWTVDRLLKARKA